MSERRPGLGKLSQRYLKDDAYTAIKSAITSMILKPGDACMESAIASELGISKTPVRLRPGPAGRRGAGGDDPLQGHLRASRLRPRRA